jgi:hypothetical protein
VRFAAGHSPFHVKGHVWQGALEYYDAHVPGGLVALGAKLNPELSAFVAQRFLAASWYDALPIAPVSHAAGRLIGIDQAQVLRDRSRWQATRDIRGIYRMLTKLASPEMVATRFGRVLLQYFDFGSSEAEMKKPGVCEIVAKGIPVPLALCIAPIAEGWAVSALEQAGARTVELHADAPRKDGEKGGMDTYAIRIEVRWS